MFKYPVIEILKGCPGQLVIFGYLLVRTGIRAAFGKKAWEIVLWNASSLPLAICESSRVAG